MAKLLFMIKIAKIIMPKGQMSSVSHKKTTSTGIEVVFEYNNYALVSDRNFTCNVSASSFY